MDEDKLFAEAMSKVKPIAHEQKKQPSEKPTVKKHVSLPVNRTPPAFDTYPLQNVSLQTTENPWILKADGISRERLKRLAAGDPAVGLTLDLHGMTRDAALDLLDHEFLQAVSHKQRVITVIHGRGLHSQGKAVLKEAVYQWLREGAMARFILAAIPQPGSGGGACLVLLRRKV